MLLIGPNGKGDNSTNRPLRNLPNGLMEFAPPQDRLLPMFQALRSFFSALRHEPRQYFLLARHSLKAAPVLALQAHR